MGRFRLCVVLLLPVLAACAGQHATRAGLDVPMPALSYAPALDGGKVTPITAPVIVKHAPYPAASFERLLLARIVTSDEVLTSTERVTGKTFAETSGDLIACTFIVEDIGWSGSLPASTREFGAAVKGMQVTFFVAPFGPVKKTEVSLTTANREGTTIEDHLRDDFPGNFELPASGFRQDDEVPLHDSFPSRSGAYTNSFEGVAKVRGKGSYRGRPVVVVEVSATGIVTGNPIGFRAYRFLDEATGLWSHSELIAETTATGKEAATLMRFRVIDDVRF